MKFENKISPYIIETKNFSKDSNEEESKILSKYWNNTFLVVDDDMDCTKIKEYMYNLTSNDVQCTNNENDVTNLTNNIINIEKKKNKYKIYLNIRETKENQFYFDNKLFKADDLKQDTITESFFIEDNYTHNIDLKNYNKFYALQSTLSKLLIKYNGKDIKTDFKMTLGFNPYPDHYFFADSDTNMSCSFISFIIVLQFSLISYNFNLRMIDEKENKLNILLERQGISKFKYNCSWLITFYSLFVFSIFSFLVLIYGNIQFHYFLPFVTMILFTFSIFSVCIFFTTCIKTTKTGSTAIKFYNFGSIFLGFVIVLPKTSKFTKIVFCFIPQINFFPSLYSIYCLNNFEKLTAARLWLKAAKMSYLETCIMFITDIVFYFGLSIFIQSYRDSGLPFFQYIKSYFTKVHRDIGNLTSNLIENDNKENIQFETHHQELSQINQQKKEQNQCLKLVNVSKNFDDLKAVDNFNGELFSNEIFCLLGHNGAGKSTTINMISGILDPDHGDILLDGISLVTNKNYLYENIGLCQQEDIFFDYLTVEEHLEYMCRIKGSKINKQEIDDLINQIELAPKRKSLCKTLSGGQKRKLCIALALIGGSKIILLDEPTSGMDVMARRALWEFLKNYKKEKILLLTTHFLDEAEYLGDRIGIMSDGHFLCSGTSSFLKSKYPCGFNINLLINSTIFNEDYKQKFYNGLLQYEPNAEIKVASKGIFSINIQSNNQKIPEIFDYIEKTKAQYGIEDYTVSSTSLEDVFLKINNKANLNDLKYSNKEENNDFNKNMNIIPTSAGFCAQLWAEIVRGMYPFYRNKTLFFFELLSGLGFVYIFILFFSDFIINATVTKLNLKTVLEANDIYIYEKNLSKDYLKNSAAYKMSRFISLKKIKNEPKGASDFMDFSYDMAFANIAKGSLYVKKNTDSTYEVYNTEVANSLYGYLYANTMLLFSSILKNDYGLDVVIFPEITYNSVSQNEGEEELANFISNSIVLIIVCFISLFGFVVYLGGLMFEKIKEKRTNIKHLLYLSGNNIFSYWLGFFIVDYLKLCVFSIFLMIPIYTVSGAANYFGLDMLGINLSSLSFIYFITFFCSKEDSGAKILFLIVFGFLIIICLLALLLKDKLTKYLASFTKPYAPNIFDFTPVTSMGLSFIRIIVSYSVYDAIDKINKKYGGETIDSDDAPLGMERPKVYLVTSYIAQIINLVLYTSLLILAESGLLGKLIHRIKLRMFGEKENYVFGQIQATNDYNLNSPLIENVPKENSTDNYNIINGPYQNNQLINQPQLIINQNPSNIKNPLSNPYVQKEVQKVNSNQELTTRIVGLTKTFYSCCSCCCGGSHVRAINNLHLGLEANEKFGLLGFNGSGKTTTFRAITNEILTDSGSITLFGYDTQRQFEKIRTMVGYCPQINPLFDFMKVKEIIKFYSQLKTCNESVESVCEKFGLSKSLDTYTVNLSGGNKRKLTFAIAMMNRPRLLLLDEPSTGVDPESRRIMWRNINELSNSGHKYNMILTTHSMEEAEVLCDTVSWFKAGNFITVGNPEELKIQYSAGYKLNVKFDDSAINKNIGGNNSINEIFNQISNLVQGFQRYSTFIFSNPAFGHYLQNLINVVQRINDKTQKISLSLIGKDFSFELILLIIKERQKDLFSEVLNMKNTDKTIAEMSISMQSLENILTSLN